VASSATVQLVSYRVVSSSFDAYGFAVSTAILPPPPPFAPGFSASTTSVVINTGFWGTTFYYLDTNANENYNLPASSQSNSAWVNGVAWSTGSQAISIVPSSIYKIGLLTAPSTLTAGATSQVFQFATQDIFGNPSPITTGDFGGPTAAFQLSSDSGGSLRFA